MHLTIGVRTGEISRVEIYEKIYKKSFAVMSKVRSINIPLVLKEVNDKKKITSMPVF